MTTSTASKRTGTIDGVGIRRLTIHTDARGSLTEIFREEWDFCFHAVQWTFVDSLPGYVRGMHVHRQRADHLVVVEGVMVVGLYDLRPNSSTYGRSILLELDGTDPTAVTIPPGVMHGWYNSVRCLYLTGLSVAWDPSDDLACIWNDPDLELSWPVDMANVSDRDRDAPSLQQLIELVKKEGLWASS